MEKKLSGQIAIITGASSGIGAGVARALAAAGAIVIVNYPAPGAQEAAEAVLSDIRTAGGAGIVYQCDVSKEDQVQKMFAEVVKQYAAAFGPKIEGLTGTPEEIADVAKEYRVYYAEHRTGSGPNDYSMDHSSVLYLMNPDGGFVAPVRADQSGDEIAANLKKLMG